MNAPAAKLKAYRSKGAAVITVTRGARTRRYRVSLLRLARLNWLLVGWPDAYGAHKGGNAFDISLRSTTGYAQALRNVRRYGGPKARALFPISPRPHTPAAVHSPAASAAGAF